MPRLDKLKILAVAPDFPFPPDHGGRTDVWGRLQAWKELGATVDLVVTVKAAPLPQERDVVAGYVRQLQVCPRTRRWTDHLSLLPFQVTSRRALGSVELADVYDVVWLDGECTWAILDNPGLRTRFVVGRINNDEARYFRELARASGSLAARAYYRLEAVKFRRLWPRVVKATSGRLCFASRDEWASYSENADGSRSCWLPSPVPLAAMAPPHPGQTGAVLFVGSLFMPNNLAGLLWYLDRVHGRIPMQGYTLTIAGNCRGADLGALRTRLNSLANVRLVASPTEERLRDLYRESAVFINPMQHGAGITLKTAHALLAGLPVVTTHVGSAGSGMIAGMHLSVADSPDDFAAAVASLLREPAMGTGMVMAAQRHLRRYFDHRSNLGSYLESADRAPRSAGVTKL